MYTVGEHMRFPRNEVMPRDEYTVPFKTYSPFTCRSRSDVSYGSAFAIIASVMYWP